MASSLRDIREAMAAALSLIPGCQASAYPLSNPTPPHLCVMRGDLDYDQAFGDGLHYSQLNVRVYVADVNDQGASMLLDEFIDPDGDRSVKSFLESDTTLGGLVQDLNVVRSTGEQVYVRDSGGPLLGSEFQITVFL